MESIIYGLQTSSELNRTYVELKCKISLTPDEISHKLNRTYVELK